MTDGIRLGEYQQVAWDGRLHAATLTPDDVLAWVNGQTGNARTPETWQRWRAVHDEIKALTARVDGAS